MIDAGTHGAVNWVDLSTPDLTAAEEFYRHLLGWSLERTDTPMGEYVIGQADGHAVAGMMQHGPEMVGSPALWTVFVFVADLDWAVATVADAGGSVLEPPFAIPGEAHVAVVADPSGAMLGLITGPPPHGRYLTDRPGGVCWVDLLTRDLAAAKGFYTALFGWKASASAGAGPPYTMFTLEGEQVAGMMAMPDEVPAEAPSHWAVYFAVEDCLAAELTATAAGGRVLHPTTAFAMGRFAVLADPQDATFHLMEHAR